MKVAWVRYPFPLHGPNHGIAKGYIQSAMFLRDALATVLGEDFCEDVPNRPTHARMRLHYCPPHFFHPKPGKVDVFFTMWEGLNIPEEFRPRFAAADVVVVPSAFCQRVLANELGITAGKAPLGVHPAFFAGDTTRGMLMYPGRRLRVLWVGSTSPRKGWQILKPMWSAVRRALPGVACELYIKTVVPQQPKPRRFADGTIVDGRDLEPAEMLQLYRSSDVVLSTAIAEGFGLTTLEGMATGALAVGTGSTGDAEFMVKGGFARVRTDIKTVLKYGDVPYEQMVGSPTAYASALATVLRDWGKPPIENARRIGAEVARAFTWENAAKALLSQLASRLKGSPKREDIWPQAA